MLAVSVMCNLHVGCWLLEEEFMKKRGVTKMDRARKIFARWGHLARKDVIRKFIKQAGLTEKGAPTYYYNISREWQAYDGRKLT
jgi:hypothetical protein